jgi:hypothetical protein
MRRPVPNVGKANVPGEETGACTLGAAGVGVQTRREGLAEITSGRACAQQGLAATCKDRPSEAMLKPGGGPQVWRMSRYERRRRGNALPGGQSMASLEAVTPTRGKAALGTWRSQVGARTLSRENAAPRSGDESMSKPASAGVNAGQDLSHAATGKAQRGKPRSEPERGNPAFRDRRGACRNVDKIGSRTEARRETAGYATGPYAIARTALLSRPS